MKLTTSLGTGLRGSICLLGLLVLTAGVIIGCSGPGMSPQDKFGRTYYIDGAGNWGFGVLEVHNGLRKAGYKGKIINYHWSFTFNPALDQTLGRPVARLRGLDLGKEISEYLKHYPQNKVNIIGLSAGTGVAVWACESLDPPAKVHNLVLLSSSLSANYDMRKALKNIEGNVWVYYSPYDQILQGPVFLLGTIDGQLGVSSAGVVGMRSKTASGGKIKNIGWTARYKRFGWHGAHTDTISERFVRTVLAGHIIPRGETQTGTKPNQPRIPHQIASYK